MNTNFDMKKILIIADIHGRDCWWDVVNNFDTHVDHICFLGDYVDSFDKTDQQIVSNFRDIIEFKKDNPDKVTLLLGNHDLSYYYINDYGFGCSGFRPSYSITISELFKENKDLFSLALQFDSTLLTHAGVTESWLKIYNSLKAKYEAPTDISNLVTSLNGIHQGTNLMIKSLSYVGKARYGDFPTGSPIWCDQRELKQNYVYGIDQIVGHSYLKDQVPETVTTETGEQLMFIDIGCGILNYPTIKEYETLIK